MNKTPYRILIFLRLPFFLYHAFVGFQVGKNLLTRRPFQVAILFDRLINFSTSKAFRVSEEKGFDFIGRVNQFYIDQVFGAERFKINDSFGGNRFFLGGHFFLLFDRWDNAFQTTAFLSDNGLFTCAGDMNHRTRRTFFLWLCEDVNRRRKHFVTKQRCTLDAFLRYLCYDDSVFLNDVLE